MARPLRVSFPGAVYHVMCRGNNRQTVLIDDRDCERFLDIMEETVEIFGVILYAYVLMGNHFHLLLKTPDGNLSNFMRRLLITYTSHVNRRHRRSGHLFQGRFRSHLVEEERYLTALSRYIHLNPVRLHGMASLSGREKIDCLKGYRWSSLEGYRKVKKQKSFTSYGLLLEPYGGNTPAGRRAYWTSLCRALKEGEGKDYPGELHGGLVLGSLEYAATILDRIKGDDKVDPAQTGILERQVSASRCWERVEEVTGKRREEVLVDRGELRDVVLEFLCRYAGLWGAKVGREFNLSSSAVSKYRKRVRQKLEEDNDLKILWAALTEESTFKI